MTNSTSFGNSNILADRGEHTVVARLHYADSRALKTFTGGFVIDEDGLGYTDIGEEIDWGKAEEASEDSKVKDAKPHKGRQFGVACSCRVQIYL